MECEDGCSPEAIQLSSDKQSVPGKTNSEPKRFNRQEFNAFIKHLLSLKTNIISMLIKIQPDTTVCRYLFTAQSHYVFRVSQHPSSAVLKTVTAASGTGHCIGTATSLQRGLSPDQAMLEGSSCTSIMTCTGGCGYSF